MNNGCVVMLVVEDNPGDVVLFTEAVEVTGLPTRLCVVNDGGSALAFLLRQDPHAGAPRPDVVVLDLNVPVRSGREVLQAMRADDTLCRIPVMILTTSTSDQDVLELYAPGPCRYEVKTPDFVKLTAIAVRAHAFGLACGQPGPAAAGGHLNTA